MTAPVEPAGPAHAAALAAIHQAAFPPGERWSRDVIALQLDLPGSFGLLAPLGGMLLARVAADEAEVVTVAVHPDLRRRGLGAALLHAALLEARRRGAMAMFLEVDVENADARRLYTRAGFNPVGVRRRYYASGHDALVLRRDLSELDPLSTSPGAAATG
jgi:ribosomal-protein-alanine N-acetyltransferase